MDCGKIARQDGSIPQPPSLLEESRMEVNSEVGSLDCIAPGWLCC